jgi:hypothetical protein
LREIEVKVKPTVRIVIWFDKNNTKCYNKIGKGEVMKGLNFVITFLLVVILSMVISIMIMFADIVPQEFHFVLGTLLLWRAIAPVAVVLTLGYLFWKVIEVYCHLPKEEKDEIHKLACPAVDAGLHEVKKRKDWLGKIANYLSVYRRFARTRQ